MDIVKGKVEEYLKEVFGGEVKVTSLEEIGGVSGDELKGFGYGKPFMINFSIGEEDRSVVLSSMRGDSFGHDHFSDRAQILIWQHSTFQNLPRHVRSLDAGYFTSSGELR
ncbi:MAG: aminoglycoside phosphotransferase family protein, partial [Halobacteriota archaeon]|nr:aminoglycoside phosphotransferase family protein [Halobacteriota archaeon]